MSHQSSSSQPSRSSSQEAFRQGAFGAIGTVVGLIVCLVVIVAVFAGLKGYSQWREHAHEHAAEARQHQIETAPRSYNEFAEYHEVAGDSNSNSTRSDKEKIAVLAELVSGGGYAAAKGEALVRSHSDQWYFSTQAEQQDEIATPSSCTHYGICVNIWRTRQGWFAEVYHQKLLAPMPASVRHLAGLTALPSSHVKIIPSSAQSTAVHMRRAEERHLEEVSMVVNNSNGLRN